MTSELLLPLAILHSRLLQRKRYSLAAYKSAPHWNISDLDLIINYMDIVFSMCDGSEKFTGKIAFAPSALVSLELWVVELGRSPTIL